MDAIGSVSGVPCSRNASGLSTRWLLSNRA